MRVEGRRFMLMQCSHRFRWLAVKNISEQKGKIMLKCGHTECGAPIFKMNAFYANL